MPDTELCAQAPYSNPFAPKPNMTVYVSGPMTGIPEHNYPAFETARKQLVNDGFTVLCPAEAGQVDGWTWEQYLTRDLRMVLDADALVTLPGWENSRGAKLEIYVASTLGKRVVDIADAHILWEI